MSVRKQCLIAVFVFSNFFNFSPGTQVLAQPLITNFVGVLAQGETITITGTGFGIKFADKPLLWADVEAGDTNPTLLGRHTIWDRVSNLSITTENQDANSTNSVRGVVNADGSPNNVNFILNEIPGITKVYAFVRRNYNHPDWWNVMAGGRFNYKFFRLWTQPIGNPTVYPNTIFTYAEMSPTIRITTEGVGGCKAGDDQDWGGEPLAVVPPVQQWLREEYAVLRGNGNGVAKFWSNGILIKDLSGLYTASGFCSPDPYTDAWASISIENFWTVVAPPQGAFVYFDDVYIDDTWARVMIGNQPTFVASTHREIQIPSSWDNSSITITLNKGSFSILSNIYLYVIDENGNVNASGFPLCSVCPDPPISLRVE